MNSKSRAELQRKLSLKAVPRPPAGLAERIKADIPQYLDTEAERARFSRSVAFNMRIAASVLVAITTAGVAMVVMNRGAQKEMAVATPQPGVFAPAQRKLVEPRTATEPAEEVRLDISEEADADAETPKAQAAPKPAPERGRGYFDADMKEETARTQPPMQLAEKKDNNEIQQMYTPDDHTVVSNAAGGFAPQPAPEPVPAGAESRVSEFRREAPAPAAPPAMDAAPPAASVDLETARVAPMVGQRAMAKLARDDAKNGSIFGISVNPEVFQKIRTTLESGGRPSVSAVNVEAIVNYFAGEPEKRPRRGARLEVEASPAPIEAEGDHAILRFTIDTPDGDANALVARDARIDIQLNGSVVAKARRIGGNTTPSMESALRYGTSVTGLYALELNPRLTSTQVVATVQLSYTPYPDGRKQTFTHVIHGSDLAKRWTNSSRRHRLASLGAIWGETLRGTAPGFDVARRAEELVSQDPKDSRAKELAAAANASAGGER